MKDQLGELVRVIEEELKLQEITLHKLEEQQKILVEYSLEKLEANLKDLEKLQPKVKKLANQRIRLKEQIGRRLGVKSSVPLSEFDLSALPAPGGGEAHGERLIALRERLMKGAKLIRTKSRENMILIRQSLELNHDLIKWIRGREIDHSATYGRDGEIVSDSNARMVDAKV